MEKTSPNHYILNIEIVDKQLNRLVEQLECYKGSVQGKGILQGLIEAYTAVKMQGKICLPIKKVL